MVIKLSLIIRLTHPLPPNQISLEYRTGQFKGLNKLNSGCRLLKVLKAFLMQQSGHKFWLLN